MGIKKLVIVLCVVSVVKANCDDALREIDSIRDESQCLSQGGICTIAADCPEGALTPERGLCPAQQYRGIECCYGQSVKETRCAKRGGSCTSEFCKKALIFAQATDCAKDTICCIRVS